MVLQALVALYLRAAYLDQHNETAKAIADYEKCLAIARKKGLDTTFAATLHDREISVPLRIVRQGLALAYYHNSEYQRADKLFSDMLAECKDDADEAEIFYNRGLTKQHLAERAGGEDDDKKQILAFEAIADFNQAITLTDSVVGQSSSGGFGSDGGQGTSDSGESGSSQAPELTVAQEQRLSLLRQIRDNATSHREELFTAHPDLKA